MFIAADAVTSLKSWERSIALKRLEKEGAMITSCESAIFEILKDSKDEKFKSILEIIKTTKRDNAIDHLWCQ